MKLMNKYILAMLSLLFLWSCTPEFDREWDLIDEDMVRPMDFVFDKPDFSAGDVVVVHAWFAGQDFNILDIDWRVSWDIVTLDYGEEKPFNIQALEFVENPKIISRSTGAQVVEFSFKVPDDVFTTNIELQKNFKELQKEMNLGEMGLPADLDSIFAYLNIIAAMSDAEKAMLDRETGAMLNALSQIFTTQFRLYANYPGLPSTYKQHGIRYHSKFKGIDGIYANDNPTIGNVVLYTVPGKVETFDRNNLPQGTIITQPVDNVLEYTFDTSKTLILGIDLPTKDSVLTLEGSLNGGDEVRIEEVEEVVFKESSTDARVMSFERFYPAGWLHSPVGNMDIKVEFDKELLEKHGDPKGEAVIFLKVKDEKWGVSYRPNGSSMKEIILKLKE